MRGECKRFYLLLYSNILRTLLLLPPLTYTLTSSVDIFKTAKEAEGAAAHKAVAEIKVNEMSENLGTEIVLLSFYLLLFSFLNFVFIARYFALLA